VVLAPETTADEVPPPLAGRRRDRGYWGEAWTELRRDWTAMAGLAIVSLLTLAAIAAPLLAPYDPDFQHRLGLTVDGQPLPPSSEFLLGTDGLGRDELSRLLYGARVSLAVGIGANLIAAALGILIGGLAGLAGPRLQTLIMRAVDVILSFPVLLLAIALLAVAQPSVTTITLIIGVSFGAYLSRLVFTQVVSLREREFVIAARTAGVRTPTILVRHVVPHVMPSVLVYCALGVATAVQLEAALSYVGIGIQVPQASWGNMIAEGQAYLTTAPWLVIFPGVAIVLAMVGFSLLGDGLRDALDPTLERRIRIRVPAGGR
jgi:peptide/nickel transport system permease protein